MGLALVAGLSTSCSNGDWEDNLQGCIGQGGNKGKVSVYFAMQAPIRVITLGNDDDAVNTDDNAHQFKLQATWGGGYKNTKDCKISYQIDPSLLPDIQRWNCQHRSQRLQTEHSQIILRSPP